MSWAGASIRLETEVIVVTTPPCCRPTGDRVDAGYSPRWTVAGNCDRFAAVERLMNTSREAAGRRWTGALAGAALMLLLAACGGSGGATGPSPPTTASTSPASTTEPELTPPAPDLTARLRIRQHQTSCCYIEGQRSYLIVRDEDGHVVAKRAFYDSRLQHPPIDVRLAPGRYVVTSYQRPCDGNCGYLDPPTDRCRATITLAANDDVVMTVEFAPGQGCQFV
jgi:hypothetical protein